METLNESSKLIEQTLRGYEIIMRRLIVGICIGLAIGVILATKAPQKTKSENKDQIKPPQYKAIGQNWKVNLTLASAFPSNMPFIGSLGPQMIERIKIISDNNITIKYHEPGALVPTIKLFDAISSGEIDSALSSSLFWHRKSPAFELFGAVPFGPDIISYLVWFRQRGGQNLYEALYSRYNIHSMVCGATAGTGAGWFNREISELNDLKKSKIAANGLISQVYKNVGAKTIQLAPDELLSALRTKAIDAVAFSTPTIDQNIDLTQHLKYYYFPGWFQRAGFIDLMINLERWNSLTKNQQNIIETACSSNINLSIAASEAGQFGALKKIINKGVEIKIIPVEVVKSLQKAWLFTAESQSKSNKDFRQILESLNKFRANYSIWRELSRI